MKVDFFFFFLSCLTENVLCICCVHLGQVGLVVGLLFAFLVLLPAVLIAFYCIKIKTSYYHKWLSQREKSKANNRYTISCSITMLVYRGGGEASD